MKAESFNRLTAKQKVLAMLTGVHVTPGMRRTLAKWLHDKPVVAQEIYGLIAAMRTGEKSPRRR